MIIIYSWNTLYKSTIAFGSNFAFAHTTIKRTFSVVIVTVIGQVVGVRHLQDLEKNERIFVRNLDVLVVGNFALHSWDIVLVPAHESLSDLLFLIDFGKCNHAIQTSLSALVLLNLFKSTHIIS